jgi:hypothetical protein
MKLRLKPPVAILFLYGYPPPIQYEKAIKDSIAIDIMTSNIRRLIS